MPPLRENFTWRPNIPAPQGNLQGLKPSQIKACERLYKRRFPKDQAFTAEQARELALLSRACGRQIGLLVDRQGKVQLVLVGTATTIYIPELPRVAPGRLRGWRLLHTHLGPGGLSQEDLMDMLFLRLDAGIALTVNPEGEPVQWQCAWIMPPNPPQNLLAAANGEIRHSCALASPRAWHDTECDLSGLARDIENGLATEDTTLTGTENAFLISVSTATQAVQERNLDELADLARSAGLTVAGRLVQRVARPDPRLILGKGKLLELEVQALNCRAELLIFDGELTPAQLHNLADVTERKVIDRTQLILDIFAQHAVTRAGKLQVELAQLAYGQPRLAGRHKALDRLAGGIGGRGPGESRLETDRRKSRERMAFLRRELDKLRRQRSLARQRRERNGLPVAALVGYTNAGKSSLLNRLTASDVLSQDRLFATLDPVTRRLRFPREREITLADTVGFIRNLPRELLEAFRATLEELERADALIHVADASHPDLDCQIAAVDTILEELSLHELPRILVLNKCDLLDEANLQNILNTWPHALPVSARTGAGLPALLLRLEQELFMSRIAGKHTQGQTDIS